MVVDYGGSLIEAIYLNENNNELLFGTYSGDLGFYDTVNETLSYVTLSGPHGRITLSPDGENYYVTTYSTGIDIVNVATRSIENISETVNHYVAYEHDVTNRLYAQDYTNKEIDIYDLSDNGYESTLDLDGCDVRHSVFDSAQENLYVACSNSNSGVRRYNLESETLETYTVTASASVHFSADESKIYAGSSSVISELDLSTGDVTNTYAVEGTRYKVTHWEEQNALLAGGNDGLYYYHLETGDVFQLSDTYANVHVLDKDTLTLYWGAGNDGLYEMDLSDL